MVYLNLRTKLRVLTGHVLQAARRVFGIPDFRFYALADGIKAFRPKILGELLKRIA
jgi:hypothetical protein